MPEYLRSQKLLEWLANKLFAKCYKSFYNVQWTAASSYCEISVFVCSGEIKFKVGKSIESTGFSLMD